jgi:outer membrane murein-binding lipoprotein Lpp
VRTAGTEQEITTVETGQKLDAIQDTVTELRVAMATLSGDVRASLARHDAADRVAADFERRMRVLERRNYAVPSLAAVLGLAGFLLALWVALHR